MFCLKWQYDCCERLLGGRCLQSRHLILCVDETSNKTEKKAIETQPSSQEPRPTLHYQTPASSLYPHIGQQKATTQVPSSQHNILPNVSNHESATDHDALTKSSLLDATLRNATTSPIHTLSPPQTCDSATETYHKEKNTVVDVNDTRTALTQDDVSRQIEDLLHRYITSAKPQQDATSQQGWVANQVQKLLLGLSTAAVETDTSADLNLSITKQTSTDNLAALKSRPESTFTAECLKIFEESDVRMREGGLLVNQVTGHEGNKQKQMEDSSSTTNSKDAATSNVFNNKATTLKTHFDTAIEDSNYQKNKSIKTHIQDTITDSQDEHVGKASATIIDKTVNQNIKSKFNLNKLKNNIVAPKLDNVVNDLDLETSSISTDILPLTDNDEKGSEDEPLKLKDSIENILLNKDDILTAKDDLNQKISDNFLISNNMTQKESDKIMPLALESGVNIVKDDDQKNTVEDDETSSKNNYEDDFDISKQTDVEENIKSSIEEDIKLNDNDVEDDDNKDEVDDGGEDSKTISSTSSKQVDSEKEKSFSKNIHTTLNVGSVHDNIPEDKIVFNNHLNEADECKKESIKLSDDELSINASIDDVCLNFKNKIMNKIVNNLVFSNFDTPIETSNTDFYQLEKDKEIENGSPTHEQMTLETLVECKDMKKTTDVHLEDYDDESLISARKDAGDDIAKPTKKSTLPSLSIDEDLTPPKLNLDDLTSPESGDMKVSDLVGQTKEFKGMSHQQIESSSCVILDDDQKFFSKHSEKKDEDEEEGYIDDALWDAIIPKAKPIVAAFEAKVEKVIPIPEVKPVVPWSREHLRPIVDDILHHFWTQRRFGKEWSDLALPKELLNKHRNLKLNHTENNSFSSYLRLIFEYIKDMLIDMYINENQPTDNQTLLAKESPRTLDTLKPTVYSKIWEVFERSAEQNRKGLEGKRLCVKNKHVDSAVDELLVRELRLEEKAWIDYAEDQVQVKHQLADMLFVVLLDDTISSTQAAYHKKYSCN